MKKDQHFNLLLNYQICSLTFKLYKLLQAHAIALAQLAGLFYHNFTMFLEKALKRKMMHLGGMISCITIGFGGFKGQLLAGPKTWFGPALAFPI